MTCRAVLFDLVDTLVCHQRNEEARRRARDIVASLGVAEQDWTREYGATESEAIRGGHATLRERLEAVLIRAGARCLPAARVEALESLLLERNRVVAYPDSASGLGALKERGYRLALVSNMAWDETCWVRDSGFDRHFDAVLLSCEVGLVKPEPEIYLLAARRVAADPTECVFVGDGRSDELKGARAVGMRAVRMDRAVKHDGPRDEYFDLRVTDLQELLDWLPPRAGMGGIGADPR
jgi:putative hydrolase of the HAD superfamily